LCRPEYEVLYGGAAGGGKSDSLLAEGLRQADKKRYRALILRKTFPELEELINRSLEIYPKAFKKAKYNDNKHCWTFPSGAKIYFGSMQHAKDRKRYAGRQYAYIAFDELTHFTYDEYSFLFSRNRCADPSIRCYIRAGTNPGGIGHGWVKERFITGKIPLKTYKTLITIDGREYERTKTFVPATVYDNEELLKGNPDYVASLALLPDAEREALLGGSWDSFTGQVFREWRNDPTHYTDMRWTHIVKAFIPPKEWQRYRVFDFGYSKPFSVGWYAMDTDGSLYRYRELYGCGSEPNTGVKWEPNEIAKQIREIEDKAERGNSIIGIADPSIWDKSRGESIAQMMERQGVYWEKADNERIAGKMQIHYRLAFDENGVSKLYVMDTQRHFIRTIPALVYDAVKVEDVDTKQEDHIYDELRYMCMYAPVPPRQNVMHKAKPYNPLEEEQTHDKYGFYRI
jgi:hypothetical protein